MVGDQWIPSQGRETPRSSSLRSNAAGSIFYRPEAPLLAVLLLRFTRGTLTSVPPPVRREAAASSRSMIDTCKAIAELCACVVCGLQWARLHMRLRPEGSVEV